MKKIFFKIIILSLVTVLAGCNDWLKVSPKTTIKAEDLFQTEAGFRDALIGVYSLMSLQDTYGSELTYAWLDVLAQYYDTPHKLRSGYPHESKEAAEYQYTSPVEEVRLSRIWSNHYSAIANINLALQYIDSKRDVFRNEDLYNIYKGEFLGLRAFLHFDILRMFAPAPVMDNGKGLDSPAIPYLTLYTNQAQPQFTVAEIISKIRQDLDQAREIMKDKDINSTDVTDPMYLRKYKMNYYAVTALYARVCLYAGEKADALAAAKEIIGEADGEIPTSYALATRNMSGSGAIPEDEQIFVLNVQKMKSLQEFYLIERGNDQRLLLISGAGKDNIFMSKGKSNDFRSPWLSYTSDGLSQMIVKFSYISYMPMLKLSELFLIAAECAGGKEGDAYLDKLRSHRGLSPMDGTNTFEEYLYHEYRREFIGEGQLFFFYKRKGMRMIGAEDNIAIDNPNEVYNLPIPLTEVEYGNIKH